MGLEQKLSLSFWCFSFREAILAWISVKVRLDPSYLEMYHYLPGMEPVPVAQLYWCHADSLAVGQYFQNMVCGPSMNESLGVLIKSGFSRVIGQIKLGEWDLSNSIFIKLLMMVHLILLKFDFTTDERTCR